MIVIPKPTRPPPVIVPSSDCVKLNCFPQSARIAPRTENPMPAAISVRKLAKKSIMLPADGDPAFSLGEEDMVNESPFGVREGESYHSRERFASEITQRSLRPGLSARWISPPPPLS